MGTSAEGYYFPARRRPDRRWEEGNVKANIGTIDRAARIVVGVGLAAAGVYFRAWWGAIAILPLATAGVRFCPLYRIVGMSTCKTAETVEQE